MYEAELGIRWLNVAADPDLPGWLPKDAVRKRAGAGVLFLFHVEEWFPDQRYTQLKRFMAKADASIMLRAKGHPDVPATLNQWYHTYPTNDGREFEVFVAHVSHGVERKETRQAQVDELVDYVEKSQRPWIVMGDMNSHPGDDELKGLKRVAHEVFRQKARRPKYHS